MQKEEKSTGQTEKDHVRLSLRLLLLYRLRMCESGRKVQTCGLFLCPEAARNSVEGFGVEAPDDLIIENARRFGGGRAQKCDRNAVNRKE